MAFIGLRNEALRLAREAKLLRSQCDGLGFQIDHGSSDAQDEAEWRALQERATEASRRFDLFVTSASQSQREAWLELVTAITAALAALSTIRSLEQDASRLLRSWRLAVTGTQGEGFAGNFIAGLELVDQNYRLLLKSGGLPPGFPRLAGA